LVLGQPRRFQLVLVPSAKLIPINWHRRPPLFGYQTRSADTAARRFATPAV
jgi:hypothetical protein